MKKYNLFLTALMSLTLVSCGATSDTSFNLKEWSTKLIDQNLVDESQFTNHSANYNGFTKKVFSEDEIYDASYAEYGLLVIKTSDNKLGFYSLTYDKWLVSPLSWTYSNSYSISQNSYVGYILYLTVGDSYYCYDGLGNEIYANSSVKEQIYIEKSNEKIYCQYNYRSVKKYYNENGVLGASVLNEDSSSQAGDKFVDPNIISGIEGIEIEGYKFSVDEPLVTVYNEDGKYKTSYSLPYILDSDYLAGSFFAGSSFIYQIVNPVASDAKDYDIVASIYSGATNYYYTNKYIIDSYKLDLLTGNVKEIDLDYAIIDDGEVYKDKKGKTSYSLVGLVFVGKDKTIKNGGEYLVDEDGNIIYNASGLEVKSFIKLDNGNYYNLSTNILYSSKLKVIAHLDSIEPIYYRGVGFIGTMNGKYGVVGEDGVISLAFEYDYINSYVSHNKVFARKDNKWYRIDLNTYSVELVADSSDIVNYDKGLVVVDKGETNSICSASTEYYSTSEEIEYLGGRSFYFGDYIYFYSQFNNYVEVITFAAKEVGNKNTFVSNSINYVFN